MPPQVDILVFSFETLLVLHLIQLLIGKHQLTYMILDEGVDWHLMSKDLVIVNL